jgi:hypothetical protein
MDPTVGGRDWAGSPERIWTLVGLVTSVGGRARQANIFWIAERATMNDQPELPPHSRASSKRLWSTPLPDGSIPFVRMQQLWDMAEGLPSRKVRVTELNALDDVRWFSDLMNKPPTCRAVAEHARDIYEADFRFPIILSPSGAVLDGMHRLCKAFLEGIEEIEAVQLREMPPARWRLLSTGEEVAMVEDSPRQS